MQPHVSVSLVDCHLGGKTMGQTIKSKHASSLIHFFRIDLDPTTIQNLDTLQIKNVISRATMNEKAASRNPASHACAPIGCIQESEVNSLWFLMKLTRLQPTIDWKLQPEFILSSNKYFHTTKGGSLLGPLPHLWEAQ